MQTDPSRRRRAWRYLLLAVVAPLGAALRSQEPGQEPAYDRLVADYEKAASADRPAARAEFVPRFLAAAGASAGTEAAVPFLLWVVQNAGAADAAGDVVAGALETLVREHAGDPRIAEAVGVLPAVAAYRGESEVRPLLDRLIEESGHPEVQARALFARAVLVACRAGEVDAEDRTQADDDLARARKLTKDPALAAQWRDFEVGERGLEIGDRAPEIAGFDLDGVPFRLSDYRGKVVVLDYWGDW